MDSLPTLYCDVDGVINIVKNRPTGVNTMSTILTRRLPHFVNKLRLPVKVTWRSDVMERLTVLPVHWVWLTTWNWEAVDKIQPLIGLENSEVLFYKMRVYELYNQKHKYDLLKTHQQQHPSPFVWVDDVATRFFDKKDWDSPDHLIIKPSRGSGLNHNNLDDIQLFIKKYVEPSSPS